LTKYLFISISLLILVFLISHYNFSLSDNPTHPLLRGSEKILNRSGHLDGYYLVDCTLYKGELIVRNFTGSLCHIKKDGNVFAAGRNRLLYLHPDNGIIWEKEVFTHHDISVDEERGEVAVPTHFNDKQYGDIHAVIVYNDAGERVFFWSPLDHIDDLGRKIGLNLRGYLIDRIPNASSDYATSVIKINSVQILKKTDLYPRLSFLKPGNLLINLQHQRIMLIVDREKNKIVWSFRFGDEETIYGGHTPRLLNSGNIILYLNRPRTLNISAWWHQAHFMTSFYNRFKFKDGKLLLDFDKEDFFPPDVTEIHEFEVESGRIVWTYKSPYHLYTPYRGSVEEQENGNLIISHTTHGGSVFEINKKKEIQWEWFSKTVLPNKKLPNTVQLYQKI
jgi:hypothetical protein